MKYQEQHEAFKRLTIQQGICGMEQFNQALPFGYSIPARIVNRWLDKILALPEGFSSQRRYVNRFKLGADPEFVFAYNRERVDARHLGLAQGLAFGMDNNGRLTEIRPYPSRSALHVTASILAALRWLALLVPKTLEYDWLAGAFLFGDGLGGHVHFGRKRPDRNAEVKALDLLDDELIALRAYPGNEVARRRQGDEHHQIYGMPGDIRKQIHGYEYRTFPSWLDSPELAFLTLTLSKLAVHNPRLFEGHIPLGAAERRFQRMFNLLSYYKDVDDDARLALCMIAKQFPIHLGGDFKKRWGIGANAQVAPVVRFIPASIKPTSEDIQEMFDHLRESKLLENRIPTPTWEPLIPPDNYEMAIKLVNTYQAKGLGELLWDVCVHKAFPYIITNHKDMRKDQFFLIPNKLASSLPLGWQKFCHDKIHTYGQGEAIYSSEKAREGLNFSECRRLLLETVLPFWQISKVKPDSYQQWQGMLVKKPRNTMYAGKMLYGVSSALPLREIR